MKSEENKNKGANPLGAAIAGAVVGAGVTAVGAIALKSKKNREKAKILLKKAKDKILENIPETEKELKAEVRKNTKKLKTVADNAKKVVKKNNA